MWEVIVVIVVTVVASLHGFITEHNRREIDRLGREARARRELQKLG